MDSEWSTTTIDGRDVVLVTVELRNPAPVDRHVRVDNRLDGPLLPPRRAGVPDPGWDEDGFAGVVPAESRRVLGYACPAPESTPPVSVVDEGRATDGEGESPAATVVRDLGDPRPPADAVPATWEGGESAETECHAGRGGDAAASPPAPDREAGDLPPPVEAWLTAVERRVDRGERLTDAAVETATAALEATAEEGDVAELDERLAADAATLRAVAERASALADRAAATEVPVPALRRLT